MPGVLEWTCRIDEVGPDGYTAGREGLPTECDRLAQELELVSLDRLEVEVTVKAVGGSGRYRLSGRLTASVVQSCVVSLEPIQSTLEEEIGAEFWPAEQIGPLSEGEHSVLEADVPEPIENGRIDIGRMVYETLSAAIDPFPRKADARIDSHAAAVVEAQSRPESPFAALAKLKKP